MKRLTFVLAFAAIAMAGHAQVSKPVQDSANKYYIVLRDFVATISKHDTTGMDALIDKHQYWRTKAMAECHTADQREAFFSAELRAYRQHCQEQAKNPE